MYQVRTWNSITGIAIAHTPFSRLLLLDRYSFCFLKQRCLSVRLFSYIHLTSALLYSHAEQSEPRGTGGILASQISAGNEAKIFIIKRPCTITYYLPNPSIFSTFLRPFHVYFVLIGGRKESMEGGNFVVSWLHYTAWLAQNLSLNFWSYKQ